MKSNTSYTPQRWKANTHLDSGCSRQVIFVDDVDDGLCSVVKCSPCSSLPSQLLDNELHILQTLSSPYIVCCLGANYTIVDGSQVSRNLFLEYIEDE